PLLGSLFQMLEDAQDRRWVVLDLGAARPQVINVLSQYRCRLDIASLGEGIETLSVDSDSTELAERVNSLLPTCGSEKTDITLCWDFPNYLGRDALKSLMANIAERSRPGAFVHALIVYSENLMNDQPGKFVPAGDGCLLSEATSEPSLAAPRYSTEDMSLCLPDFSIERARLLSNGMQEYLFRR
ncbi:MAG: hypothetical protein ACR2QQ_12420, partial [Gammaproteobacteria bacterium]